MILTNRPGTNTMTKSYYLREQGETVKEAIEAHVDGGFEDALDAVEAADRNITPGAAYEVIDQDGVTYFRGTTVDPNKRCLEIQTRGVRHE